MKGGSIFSLLAGLATKALPSFTKVAANVLYCLAKGVSPTLASLDIEKLFGSNIFRQPEQILNFLPYTDVFTPSQIGAMHQAQQGVYR